MKWTQTTSGAAYDLDTDPDPASIRIDDIAFAISHIHRFTGHAGAYSVAQHSALACFAAERLGHSAGVCAAALLHDAHEAYTGDVASPIKRVLGPAWRGFEARHERAVRHRFGVLETLPDAVKEIDLRLLVTERRDLLRGAETRPWGIDLEPFDFPITRWSGEASRRAFLAACERYGIR
jgi:uncharacterized protein